MSALSQLPMKLCAACSNLMSSMMVSDVCMMSAPPLQQAIDDVIASKKRLGRRDVYTTGLRQYLSQFARGREAEPISSFTTHDVEKWFESRTEQPSSQKSNLGRLSAMFSYAKRHNWIDANPCEKIEMPYDDGRIPKIWTPEETLHALKTCFEQVPELSAWLVLATFVGLRPEAEADKIERGRVDLENSRLIVTVSKIRSYRIIDLKMCPPAVPWLQKAFEIGGRLPIPKATRKRYVQKLRVALGMETWVQDLTRHTAASYLVAYHADSGKVATMLGNSVGVLNKRYRALVTPEDAARFMALKP